MKFFIDFAPVVIFFATYKMSNNIIYATGAFITASLFQIIATKLIYKKVEKLHIITFIVIASMGGLTIWLNDDSFIKWKVTIVSWGLSVTLVFARYVYKKNLVKALMDGMSEEQFNIPDFAWDRLNWMWILFNLFIGTINLYVMNNYSTDTWMNFKLYGFVGLSFAFAIIQAIYMTQFMTEDVNPKESSTEAPQDNKEENN